MSAEIVRFPRSPEPHRAAAHLVQAFARVPPEQRTAIGRLAGRFLVLADRRPDVAARVLRIGDLVLEWYERKAKEGGA